MCLGIHQWPGTGLTGTCLGSVSFCGILGSVSFCGILNCGNLEGSVPMKFDARLFKLLPYCYLSKKKKKLLPYCYAIIYTVHYAWYNIINACKSSLSRPSQKLPTKEWTVGDFFFPKLMLSSPCAASKTNDRNLLAISAFLMFMLWGVAYLQHLL